MKLLNLLWGLSLAVIGVGTLVLSVSSLAGFALPDAAVRLIGILNLIALPVMAFATVKKLRKRAEGAGAHLPAAPSDLPPSEIAGSRETGAASEGEKDAEPSGSGESR